ncbi:MAG: response regulator transcription factor [Lentisphaeria bacterium]|nr:response regulator transcription factor [Lentisphaeria bacterium]
MNILVVEDDQKTADLIRRSLEESGYTVTYAADGKAGIALLDTAQIDLAIIDIMLPYVDGFTVISTMRQKGISCPVIILSARDSLDDKVHGLQTGGDVYLSKPFSIAELLANVQAQLRRAEMHAEPTTLTVADLTIDLLTRKVQRAGQRIDIPPREYELLEYLMRNTGQVVTRSMIIEHVWEYNFDPETTIVETRIYKLREKIDKPFERELIHTVRGIGYVLE